MPRAAPVLLEQIPSQSPLTQDNHSDLAVILVSAAHDLPLDLASC
jgi:hypothetical protein